MSKLKGPLIRDKHGRQLEVGDLIKVFHFTGGRRKKHYMYKYIKGVVKMPLWTKPMFKVSHLSEPDAYFHMNEHTLDWTSFEIVQGYNVGVHYEDREKVKEVGE